MRQHLQSFIAIARLALLESLRQPVVVLLTLSTVVFTALLPVLITHVLGDGQRLVRDSGLALHLVSGLVLGAYSACASLRDEVRRGTASAILSKPVSRSLFLLAKFSGLAVVMALYSCLLAGAIVLACRTARQDFMFDPWGSGPLLLAVLLALLSGGGQSFFLRRPFCSRCFGTLLITLPMALVWSGQRDSEGAVTAIFGSALPMETVPASLLILMAILILTGLSVSLATRLDVVPTLAACATLLMLGMMADYALGAAATQHRLAAIAYALVPNFQHFWTTDALARGPIPWSYVVDASYYGVFYLAGILCAGIVAFRHMELRG